MIEVKSVTREFTGMDQGVSRTHAETASKPPEDLTASDGNFAAPPSRWDQVLSTPVVSMVYLLGVIVRYLYIFHWNRAMDYRFSDMKGYYDMAQRFNDPNTIWSIADTVVPPASYWYFGWLMWIDPKMDVYMVVQFVLACLVPILIAAIGRDLFGRSVALLALCIASLYYPLFDYFGFFMTEGPFMTMLLTSFWLLIRSLRAEGKTKGMYGLLGGLALGSAAAFKTVALPAAFLVFLALIWFTWRGRLRKGGLTIMSASIGLLIVLTPMAIRGTKLSNDEITKKDGKFRFCLIANDSTRNILLGHYGRIGGIRFFDRRRGTLYGFGSPSAPQNGYTHTIDMDIGVYEQSEILDIALTWIAKNPREALQLSFDHMFDLFFGTYTWPSLVIHPNHSYVRTFAQIFLVFLLFPACMHLVRISRDVFRQKGEVFGDLLLFLPLLALMIVAFISLGEPRYRIPFDGFIILLACRLYCGLQLDRKPILVERQTAIGT